MLRIKMDIMAQTINEIDPCDWDDINPSKDDE
jgi:hypothetical protein